MEEQNLQASIASEPQEYGFRYFPFFNKKQPVFVLVLIGFIFYCTSLYNEYALDDGIIIHQNDYVLKGARGIKDILTSDVYDSFYARMNAKDQLQGGRYRPLSVVSFALEQELIATYRTGNYMQVEDLNKNGKLDDGLVNYSNESKESIKQTAAPNKSKHVVPLNNYTKQNYEYNYFTDVNKDGVAQANECNTCWDLNKNFINDATEDLNKDGIFNEVDCQVKGAFIRHFNNVWMYILACISLYLLLRNYLLKDNQDLAFLATLLFITHPLHTEVVANVKSRDDIFSLLFISLTFLFAFKFITTNKMSTLITCALMFFLALLSKEFAMLLFLLLPIAFYVFNKAEMNWKGFLLPLISFVLISVVMTWIAVTKIYGDTQQIIFYLIGVFIYACLIVFVFRNILIHKGLNAIMIVLYGTALLYLAIRYSSVNMIPGVPDTEILNNPYLLASGHEAFATKIFVLLKYFTLAFFPHPLISDYSFETFRYRHFSDWDVIVSALLHVALIYAGIKLVLKRHIIGFAIITYLICMLLVTNFIFPIGATMGERLLFHSTIGFAIAFAWLILKGLDRITTVNFKTKRTALISVLFVIITLYGCKTWERNWDWKNDVTLFLKDVKNAPHSVLVLGNAGARWIDLADTKEITGFALPGEDNSRFNDYNGQLKITDEELKLSGCSNKREVALYKGINYLKHAVELHPKYVNGYLNLGLASYKLGKQMDAIYYWKRAEFLYPNNPYLANYYSVVTNILKESGTAALERLSLDTAVNEFKKWTIIQPKSADAWQNLGTTYLKQNKNSAADKCFRKVKELEIYNKGSNNTWNYNKKGGC